MASKKYRKLERNVALTCMIKRDFPREPDFLECMMLLHINISAVPSPSCLKN